MISFIKKTFKQNHASLAISSRKVIFQKSVCLLRFPLPSLLCPGSPTGSVTFSPYSFFWGFSQWEALAGDLKTGGECDLGVLSPSSLSLQWVFLSGAWIGHSSCPCGSLRVLVTPPRPFVPSGPAAVAASSLDVFCGPSPVLCQLSLFNSPGFPSPVCHLFVATTLSNPRDILTTPITHFYKSKNIFSLCCIVFLLQSLEWWNPALRFRKLGYESQLLCNVALGLELSLRLLSH